MLLNSPAYPLAIGLVTAILLLAGCGDGGGATLEAQHETLQRYAPGCDGKGKTEQCDSVVVKWEVFEGRPALNDAIRAQLIRQLRDNGIDRPPEDSLESLADAFIAEATRVPGSAPWQLTGEVKRLSRRGDLLTLAIDSYIFTGGAHGLPATHWLNWNLATNQAVTLEEVLQAGRAADFWQRAREVHQQWLEKQSADEDFRRNWPFHKTTDFRFDDQGLVLLYGVYELGPYAMGQVELKLPWERLRGVVRGVYLPEAP